MMRTLCSFCKYNTIIKGSEKKGVCVSYKTLFLFSEDLEEISAFLVIFKINCEIDPNKI